MAKFVFLLILACATYVCAYPSETDLSFVGEIPPKSRHPRAAYHDSLGLETHGHRNHAHLDDGLAHHDHTHDHGHHHDHLHDHDVHHDHLHDHDVHHDHPHDHDHHHDHLHDHDIHYDVHHDHSHDHGVHYNQQHGHDHPQRPGYDEIYVYIDVPETYSKNSQASVIEAALIDVEDDADLRRVISDIISSELQDQKTPKNRYPLVHVDKKSPSDPDPTLSPEFIRRK